MQKINRENLQTLYKTACSAWQKTINDLLSTQTFNTEIEIQESLISSAYKEANAEQKKLIKRHFELPKDRNSSIKSFDDVLRLSGKTLEEILPWKNPKTKNQISQNALAKIQLIAEVYNEGEKLDWNNTSQYKYFPYFEKKSGGWGFVVSDYDLYFGAFVSGSCYFKSKEDSDNAGRKFLSIYKEYLPE